MVTQGPFDWQGRLESEGEVAFGSRWWPGSGRLSVTREGFRTGSRPVIAFDRIVAVGTAGGRLTVIYTPSTGERLNALERRSGHKSVIITLSRWGQVRSDDLAVWLLKLKGGPLADVESRAGGGGVARVYRIRA